MHYQNTVEEVTLTPYWRETAALNIFSEEFPSVLVTAFALELLLCVVATSGILCAMCVSNIEMERWNTDEMRGSCSGMNNKELELVTQYGTQSRWISSSE